MKNILDIHNYLKVCPLVPDLRSFLLVHKSNLGPHVLSLWMKNFLLAPPDHELIKRMQRKTYIQAAYHL